MTTSGHLCFLSIEGGGWVSLVTFPSDESELTGPESASRGPRLPPVAERPQTEKQLVAEGDQGAEQRAASFEEIWFS